MSTVDDEEKVLCVERSLLPESWIGEAVIRKMPFHRFQDHLKGPSPCWMPRSEAETNREYKQLIPYVVLQTVDGRHTACYLRNGAEARLHALWSVGMGGHLNEQDSAPGMPVSRIVTKGMERELREEFVSMPGDVEPVFHGVINEEKTAVGHVHLGLVYRVLVREMAAFVPGRELEDFVWLARNDVYSRPLELWSRLALQLLEADWA